MPDGKFPPVHPLVAKLPGTVMSEGEKRSDFVGWSSPLSW